MARILILTNSTGASAEVLPALGLLQHHVRILPAVGSVLVDIPEVDCLFIDARRDLPAAKSLTKLIATTGAGCPIVLITTEGGLSATNADWGFDDVILDTAGPAEVDARIRVAIGKLQALRIAADPTSGEIRRFMVGPVACEITGVAFAPDHKTMFVGIQHPGEGLKPSHFPDGGDALRELAQRNGMTKVDGTHCTLLFLFC